MDKLKSLLAGSSAKQHAQPRNEGTCARLAWPPKLTSPPRVLGEVKDTSGRPYPRDLGRSIQLGEHTYYLFGDTFCFDASGQFLGVTNNTIALIPSLSDPTKSQWLSPAAKVPEFVPLSKEEAEFGRRHAEKGENQRFVNWSFGGVIERLGCNGKEAWLFYDTVEIHDATPVRQCGIGLALATLTDPTTGAVSCKRVSKFPLFDPDGPAWGNMSNISAPDGYTYLLTGRELDNYLARIRTDADFSNPNSYEFLAKGGRWVKSYKAPYGPFGELAHDILAGQGQGAILYLPEFTPMGKPYLWIGNEKFLTSKLWVGVAPAPAGPWDLHSMGEMPKILGEQSKTRYCIYPHLWGSNLNEGRMLISWSDDGVMGGKVAAGVFDFAVE